MSVVEGSDVVVTTTPSTVPYPEAGWLHAGLHITCMGSDAEHKQEFYPEAMAKAGRIICDGRVDCPRLGELHHAVRAGTVSEPADITELGDLTAGHRPGRQNDPEVTIGDLTGVGVEDTAIALMVYTRAREKGFGTTFGYTWRAPAVGCYSAHAGGITWQTAQEVCQSEGRRIR